MAVPKANITKRAVDALKLEPGKTRTILWDRALTGFGCMALPSGKKIYIVQYSRNGRSSRVTIGEHGALTADQARNEAQKIKGKLASGVDPAADRNASRASLTFNDIAADYMHLEIKPKRKDRTVEEYSRIFALHIRPAFGSRRMGEIGRADVSRLHSSMSDTPYEANRTRALISSIWNYAEKRGEVPDGSNPCRHVERFPEESRERYLTTDELGRLADALGTVQADQNALAAISKLLLLTGARLREVLHARWAYVDLERGVLNLPDSKTGKKTIILSPGALEIIHNLPREDDHPYLIPGAKPGAPRVNLHTVWRVVCAAAEIEGVRIHDLHHTSVHQRAAKVFLVPRVIQNEGKAASV
jgi:integrase